VCVCVHIYSRVYLVVPTKRRRTKAGSVSGQRRYMSQCVLKGCEAKERDMKGRWKRESSSVPCARNTVCGALCVCVCVCVCVCIYVCIYVHVHVYVYAYIHTYIHICVYVHTHTHTHTSHAPTHAPARTACVSVPVQGHMHIDALIEAGGAQWQERGAECQVVSSMCKVCRPPAPPRVTAYVRPYSRAIIGPIEGHINACC
jgi:hypothetical protein